MCVMAGSIAAPNDDDGAVLASHGDDTGLVGAQRSEAIRAHHMRCRLAHRSHKVVQARLGGLARCWVCGTSLVSLFDKMGENLGVGIAREAMTSTFKFLAQLCEVLDDTVVHDSDPTVAARVRMRVRNARATVRCPTSMTDAAGRCGVDVLELGLETGHLPNATVHVELHGGGRLPLEGDACRVVAAIFEPFKAIDEYVFRLAETGVANDSTHGGAPLQR